VLVDRDAPLRFLRTAFLPDDWIAVLLKRYDTGEAVQRVGPVAMVLDPRFQSWLRFKNARRFNVFVSVNALTPGRRSRTRDSVSAVRHVFLDADREADGVLDAIAQRPDLPAPSCVVRSSKGRAHVLWRVDGLSTERAEALQKQLAREVGTDVVATSAAQMTRLPGFLNHKYMPVPLVHAEYSKRQTTYGFEHVRILSPVAQPPAVLAREHERSGSVSMLRRAHGYLAATPAAVAGHGGDALTFRVCCRLSRQFGLSEAEAVSVLGEWNARCEPPWSERDLLGKWRRAVRCTQQHAEDD
jgi:hypothetical protein